jgi:hypothetical protein
MSSAGGEGNRGDVITVEPEPDAGADGDDGAEGEGTARKKAKINKTVSGLFGTAFAAIKGIVGGGGGKEEEDDDGVTAEATSAAATTSVEEVSVSGAGSKMEKMDAKKGDTEMEGDKAASKKGASTEEGDIKAASLQQAPARRTSGRATAAAATTTTAAPSKAAKATAAKAAAARALLIGPGDDGLTVFEREREERIARNKERMAALNIGQLAAEVASAGTGGGRGGPIQRGIGAKRQRPAKEEPGPIRRSLRGQKIAPDAALAGGIDYEQRDGTVILTNRMTSGGEGEAVDKAPSRPMGDVPLESVNGGEGADESFIKFLRSSLATPTAAADSFQAGLYKCESSCDPQLETAWFQPLKPEM